MTIILIEPDYLSPLPKTHMSIVRAGNYGRGADRRSEGDKKATKEASVESEELSALCTATTPTSPSTTYRGIKRFCMGVKCIHGYTINAHQPPPKYKNVHQNRPLPTNIHTNMNQNPPSYQSIMLSMEESTAQAHRRL